MCPPGELKCPLNFNAPRIKFMILNTFAAYLSLSHLICKYFVCVTTTQELPAWLSLFSSIFNHWKLYKNYQIRDEFVLLAREDIPSNSAGYYENQKPQLHLFQSRKIKNRVRQTDRQTFDKLQWLKNDDSKGKQTEKAKLIEFPHKYCQDNAHPAPTVWKI